MFSREEYGEENHRVPATHRFVLLVVEPCLSRVASHKGLYPGREKEKKRSALKVAYATSPGAPAGGERKTAASAIEEDMSLDTGFSHILRMGQAPE